MQNCEGEQKRSGSLIKSCHGPLKIFSQQPGKKKKKDYYYRYSWTERAGRVLGVGGGAVFMCPFLRTDFAVGCHQITDNNVKTFHNYGWGESWGKAAMPTCHTVRMLAVMMKELQLMTAKQQQSDRQRGAGPCAEYLWLSIMTVCWVHRPRGSHIFQRLAWRLQLAAVSGDGAGWGKWVFKWTSYNNRL